MRPYGSYRPTWMCLARWTASLFEVRALDPVSPAAHIDLDAIFKRKIYWLPTLLRKTTQESDGHVCPFAITYYN
ncbi:hypothetical protein IW261DRAFT_923330 [Armillaria novae-zelandiae]|uniref:Uncharacterized protein n=1 Tax=Armillaria novae-zelandiae TaxID=153914 RepID=A0AA39NSB8_9AGAR|nr:hypothetical protein IW261DRAFT_923330 [Armillaria novae-zelandiae]